MTNLTGLRKTSVRALEGHHIGSASHSGVLVGPGDDAAVLPPVAPLVVSVDQCIEHLHFLPGTPLADVGVKSVRGPRGILRPWRFPSGLVATAFLPASMTPPKLCCCTNPSSKGHVLTARLLAATHASNAENLTRIHLTVVLGSVRPVCVLAQRQATGFLSRGAWEARLLQAVTWPRRSGSPKRFNCVRALVMACMP